MIAADAVFLPTRFLRRPGDPRADAARASPGRMARRRRRLPGGRRGTARADGAPRPVPSSSEQREAPRQDPVQYDDGLRPRGRRRAASTPWPSGARLRPGAARSTATAATWSPTATGTGARGDRRRPRHPPPRLPRRHRELAARLQHRHRGPHAPTRSSPPRCTSSGGAAGTGAAPWSPTATSTSATMRTSTASPRGRRREDLPDHRDRQPPRGRAAGAAELPRRCVLALRAGRAGADGRGREPGRQSARSRSSARRGRSTRARAAGHPCDRHRVGAGPRGVST